MVGVFTLKALGLELLDAAIIKEMGRITAIRH